MSSVKKRLIATWSLWSLSLTTTPIMALSIQRWIQPDASDDFGMGPFLAGVFLGALLSVFFGMGALLALASLRKTQPLRSNLWRGLETAIVAAPPLLILCGALGAMGGNFVVAGGLYLLFTILLLLAAR